MRHAVPARSPRPREMCAVFLVSLVASMATVVGVGSGAAGAQPIVRPPGYVLAAADGGVFAFGRPYLGSAAKLHLRAPVAGIAATPDGGGYWLVASDGGVFAFGDAHFFGSLGGLTLNQPIEGIAATPDGGGYWLVASDGGVFAFGDAHFFGSLSGAHILSPIVDIATTGDGAGYWLLTDGGEAFALGDALAPGAPPAAQFPDNADAGIAHIAGTTRGIAVVAVGGEITTLGGEAAGCGNIPTPEVHAGIVGIATATAHCGQAMAGADGGVFALGVPFLGSAARIPLASPVIGIAS
jgi:hypothetical protein